MIDRILHDFHKFCRAYVDNIVIFSATLKKHFDHLSQIFDKLNLMNIHLTATKFFLKYSSVHFLKQKIDTLNLIMAENKLLAIVNLEFLKMLAQLKKYFSFTDYLYQYIFFYIIISNLLQL